METLPIDFVTGLLLGLFLGLALAATFYGIPALWWWWADRHPVATADELLADDVERCDMCLVELTDEIAAITCDAHRYCGECDDDSNRCTACSEARWSALIEETA